MVNIDPTRATTAPEGWAELVAERDRRAATFAAEQEKAAQRHQVRLSELAATGRPVHSNFTGITGIANLAAEDAAWAPGAGLERIARMEYDLAPGVRQMDAAQLREFVESGAAEAWRKGEIAKSPPRTSDPFSPRSSVAESVASPATAIAQGDASPPSPHLNAAGPIQDRSAALGNAQIDVADELIALIASQQAADEFFATAAKVARDSHAPEWQRDR